MFFEIMNEFMRIVGSAFLETAIVYIIGIIALVIWAVRNPKNFDKWVDKMDEPDW